MPKRITKTVYTFQELLDMKPTTAIRAAVEKARDWLREGVTDHNWWYYTYQTWEDALDQIGFTDAKISFSGFYSQGDGASFTAKVDLERMVAFFASPIEGKNCIEALAIDKDKPGGFEEDLRPWLVHKISGKITNPKYRFIRWLDAIGCVSFESRRSSNHYSHSKTRHIESDWPEMGKRYLLEKLLLEWQGDLENLRMWLSDAIYKDLETEFEYLTSDEQLAENAAANEYTFTINGEREG